MSSASERHVGIVDFDVDRLPVDTERRLHRRLTRQIVPLPSSVTNSEPSFATATPTGRPQTWESETTKPVMKSSYSPVGLPLPSNSSRTTLYPVRLSRFQDPCIVAKALPLYSAGKLSPW